MQLSKCWCRRGVSLKHALSVQDCAPVPLNTTFAIDSLFPVNKAYYGYRSVGPSHATARLRSCVSQHT